MKNGTLFFLGLVSAVGLSWAGIVVGTHGQIGRLTAYYDNGEGQAYPAGLPGLAAQGQAVYRSLGCAACHTQQVRRPDFGSDQARGWGERQSVARDYIGESPVQLGETRIGPDLANLGGRKPAAPTSDELLALLYTGKGAMPAYRFLFRTHRIYGQPSAKALLPLTSALRSPAGTEILPTEKAELLVAYLQSLNQSYEYPEARPAPAPKAEESKEAAHK